MSDAYLTPDQQHAIVVTDALMEAAGLPTYTGLLGKLEQVSRPLPAAQTIELDALETSEREAIDPPGAFRLNLPEVA